MAHNQQLDQSIMLIFKVSARKITKTYFITLAIFAAAIPKMVPYLTEVIFAESLGRLGKCFILKEYIYKCQSIL